MYELARLTETKKGGMNYIDIPFPFPMIVYSMCHVNSYTRLHLVPVLSDFSIPSSFSNYTLLPFDIDSSLFLLLCQGHLVSFC